MCLVKPDVANCIVITITHFISKCTCLALSKILDFTLNA